MSAVLQPGGWTQIDPRGCCTISPFIVHTMTAFYFSGRVLVEESSPSSVIWSSSLPLFSGACDNLEWLKLPCNKMWPQDSGSSLWASMGGSCDSWNCLWETLSMQLCLLPSCSPVQLSLQWPRCLCKCEELMFLAPWSPAPDLHRTGKLCFAWGNATVSFLSLLLIQNLTNTIFKNLSVVPKIITVKVIYKW